MTKKESEAGEEYCRLCLNTGWAPRADGRVERCECVKKRILEARLDTILKDWPEYISAELRSMKPKDKTQERALEVIRANPLGSFFISGYYSRGKTHMMIAQYRYQALSGRRCILRSARDLMEELRRAEAPADANHEVFESPVLQMVNLAHTGHLFIDDIEKASARSEFRKEMLFDLFDTIKRRELAITVTSNRALDDVAESIDDAAAARLARICQEINL